MDNNMWQVSAGTLMGPYHKKHGIPNQDAHGSLLRDDYVVIAAADGAGSLELSDIGSRLAVDVVLEEIDCSSMSHGLDLLVELSIESAKETLNNHPDRDKIGCTLAVAVAGPEGWAVGVVGDAFAVVQTEIGEYKLITSPPAGEYANITKLLTSDVAPTTIAHGNDKILGLAVSSDGLELASLQGGMPVGGFWDPVFSWSLTGSLDVEQLFTHMNTQDKIVDDTTLVVATFKS